MDDESKKKFDSWFNSLDENEKNKLENPSLENLLNGHANKIYQSTHEYYNSKNQHQITKEESNEIVKTLFQSLVRFDEGRFVRNRMSLSEITQILNKPRFNETKIASAIELFRIEGNSLLKPYSDAKPTLENETVLDITHESLIRNWQLLKDWANEDEDNFSDLVGL